MVYTGSLPSCSLGTAGKRVSQTNVAEPEALTRGSHQRWPAGPEPSLDAVGPMSAEPVQKFRRELAEYNFRPVVGILCRKDLPVTNQ